MTWNTLRIFVPSSRIIVLLPTHSHPGIVDDRDKNALQDFVLSCKGESRRRKKEIYIYTYKDSRRKPGA